MQIALPNRTTFQLPAKRGLVQIAKLLTEHSRNTGRLFPGRIMREDENRHGACHATIHQIGDLFAEVLADIDSESSL
jgi:hypothetical protein